MKPKYDRILRSAALTASIVITLSQAAHAASYEWQGSTTGLTGGTDQTWNTNTTANWWDGLSTVNWPALGGTDDDAVFGGTAGTVTITTATANDITFNTTGYTLTGGTLTLNGTKPTITTGTGIDASIASIIGGASGLTKAGAGILTLSGANTYTGATSVSNGTLVLASNRAATAGTVNVGDTAGQTGTLNIQGNLALGTSQMSVGSNASGATGIVNHSAGTVSFTSGSGSNALLIGRTTGGVSGTYNLSGGTLTTFASTTRGVMIGVNDGSLGNLINATFNLSGTGNLNNTTGALQVVRGDSTSSFVNATYNQTGGTSTNGTLVIGGNGANGANSTATFSVTGGTFSATTFSNLSRGNGVSSALTLGGTADVTLPAFPTLRGTGSTATLTFDGGVLRPTASSTAYLGGLNSATVNGGGATFNTGAFDITVSQSLLAGTGSGGLTKQGAGRLILTGTNGYAGGSSVSAGILQFGNTASLPSSGAYSATSTGTLAVNAGGLGEFSNATSGAGSIGGFFSGASFASGTAFGIDTTNAGGSLSYAGNFSGTGIGITKLGTGTLTLSGNNTHTGATTISGGTLAAGSSTAFNNTGALVMSGTSTLNLNGFNAAFNGDVPTGVATSTITDSSAGAGTSTLTFNQTSGTGVSTAALITNGAAKNVAIAFANNNGAQHFTNTGNTFSGGLILLNNATTGTRLQISSVPSFAGTPGALTSGNYGTGTITVGQAATDKAGIYISAANVTLANAVVANTRLGTDRVGTFRIDSTGNTLSGQLTAGASDFTLSTNGTGAVNLTGQITGGNGLRLLSHTLGGAALTVTLTNAAGTNDYSGNTLINDNAQSGRSYTLSLGAANQIPNGTGKGNVVINSNGTGVGTLRLGGFSETINGLSGNGIVDGTSGTPTLTLGDNNATGNSFTGVVRNTAGSLTVTKIGTGTQTLTGANTYSGGTTISGGTLSFANGSLGTTGAITVNGGALQWNGTNTQDISARLTLQNGGAATLDTLANNVTLGTAFGGSTSSSLTKIGSGTLTLAGANTYSGATAINGGTIQISAASALGDGSATNTISLNTGTLRSTANTYDLGANRNITLAGAGTIRSDAGTLTVSGNVTNGANGLTLLGDGQIAMNGVIGTGTTPTGGLTIGSSTVGADVTLSNNNLFTGNVSFGGNNTQPQGKLTITHSGALGVGPKTVTATSSNNSSAGIHLQNDITLASNISFTTSGYAITNDSGNNTINGNFTLASGNGNTHLTSTGGLLTLNGNFSANITSRNLELRGAGDGIINGIIANGSTAALEIRKSDGGTWTLAGANTNTGATTISAGTLRVGAASGAATSGTLASSASITNNASLIFRRTDASAVDLAKGISGTGSVTYEGSGSSNQSQYTVNDASSYQGGTTISNARAAVTNATGFGTNTVVINSGGQAYLNAAISMANNFSIAGNGWTETSGQLGALRMANGSAISGVVTMTANSRIATNTSGAGTFSGEIGGGFDLEIGEDSATGTVIFSGNNTYSGTTTVGFGTLQASHANALGGTTNGTSVTSGGALALAGGTTVSGETITISGVGSGDFAGALKAGTGGGTWAGEVILGATLPRIGAVANETLTVTGSIVNGASNAIHISGLSGTGAVVLNPTTTNTYTGNTNIFRGILRLGKTDALPTGTTLDVDGANGIADAVSFDLAGFNQTVGGLQDTATTSVNGVITNSAGSTTSLLTVNQAGNTDFGGAIQNGSGTVALTKSGAGTLTLSGANTYTGDTNVSGGALLINGSVSTSTAITVAAGATLGGSGNMGSAIINGILSPGNSIGTLTAAGDVTWNSNNAWAFELGLSAADLTLANSTPGLSDLLDITGAGNDFLKGTGTGFTFDFGGTGAVGYYKLVDWADTATTDFLAGDFAASNLTSGLTGNFIVDSGTSALYLNVIPEPSTLLLGALGSLLLFRRKRDRDM